MYLFLQLNLIGPVCLYKYIVVAVSGPELLDIKTPDCNFSCHWDNTIKGTWTVAYRDIDHYIITPSCYSGKRDELDRPTITKLGVNVDGLFSVVLCKHWTLEVLKGAWTHWLLLVAIVAVILVLAPDLYEVVFLVT